MKKTFPVSIVLLTLIFFLAASRFNFVLAGGGNIVLNIDEGVIEDKKIGEKTPLVVEVYNDDGTPCNGCAVTYRMEREQPGDYFQGENKTDDKGIAHGSVASAVGGKRYAYVLVKYPGKDSYIQSSIFVIGYLGDSPLYKSLSATHIDGFMILSQEPYASSKGPARRVTMSWDAPIDNTTFRYTVRSRYPGENSYAISAEEVNVTQLSPILSNDQEELVSIQGCTDDFQCIESDEISLTPQNFTTKDGPAQRLSASEDAQLQKHLSALNSKISSLEAQVEKQNKKTSFLEQQLANLTALLHRLLPWLFK